MIVLDTHIWVWLVHGDANLPDDYATTIARHERDGPGICAISYREVAKLVQSGRLVLPCAIDEWMDEALAYPGMRVLELSPRFAIEATRLPAPFHKDPADQSIVASARIHHCELPDRHGFWGADHENLGKQGSVHELDCIPREKSG